jgi:glycosyltransferase involved in cell wall biosynthesis
MTSSIKSVASAILAVYNAQSTILPCIESLLGQSAKVEIIVVDDGSTDGTLKKLNIYKDIKILKQSHGGPALARNLGSSHANSDILLFVDADMIFDRDYVQDLIHPILNYSRATAKLEERSVGTYTTEEQVANWDNVWARCWNVQEGWEDEKRFPKNPPKYGTDFRAILKSEFDKIGGFDNIGYTDTWSLFNKLGVKPLSTKAICYHKNPGTLAAVFSQARWAAKRPYKYGIVGTLYALVRTSLPISLVVGIVKSYKDRNFAVFKIIYDLGRFVGILEMMVSGNLAK